MTLQKNERNVLEHGLEFVLVAEMDWMSAMIDEDTRQDYDERRFGVFSCTYERLHALVFTPRAGKLHIISPRKANAR